MNQIKINTLDMAELRELGREYNLTLEAMVEMAIAAYIDGAQNGALELFASRTSADG